MRIKTQNLGPVRNAEVETKRLTVLVGPNGTGKSYIAKVIFGLHRAYVPFVFEQSASFVQRNLFHKRVDSINRLLEQLHALDLRAVSKAATEAVDHYGRGFTRHLSTFFAGTSVADKQTSIVVEPRAQLSEAELSKFIK